jgi:hypothetical protein
LLYNVNSGGKLFIFMAEKSGVTKATITQVLSLSLLLYFSALSPALLMLPALLACFGQPVSADELPPVTCPDPDPPGVAILLPHPTDCSIYFQCSNGVPIEMHCPPGLQFNKQLKVCDWPENANCGKLSRLYLTQDFVFSSNYCSLFLLLCIVLVTLFIVIVTVHLLS